MNKKEVIKIFKRDHQEFMDLIGNLSDEDINKVRVVGEWTTKEVIAHLAAWNWEQAKEIKRVLKCEPTWNDPTYPAFDEDIFNRIEVRKRKDKQSKQLFKELDESFDHLIDTIRDLSEEEWEHVCEEEYWEDGSRVTIRSLFPYESEGISDTGRHTEDIKGVFEKL